ncbi:MAG: hypothetical protein U0176_13800 [Bacteroidia bacterium]
METTREKLISAFSDGKSPNGGDFRLLVNSIVSRKDDGIEKTNGGALQTVAGSAAYQPVLEFCPDQLANPHWVICMKPHGKDGLNFATANAPEDPILYLDAATQRVGIGTQSPAAALEVHDTVDGEHAILTSNDSDGVNNYVIHRLRAGTSGDGVIFKNANTRAADGGADTMTIRNDGGALRLQSAGAAGSVNIAHPSGFVGVGVANPQLPLEVNGHTTLNGGSLFLPGQGQDVNTTAQAGIFWKGNSFGSGVYNYGIYRTPGNWTSNNFQQLRMQFDTGIQLGAGTGANTGFDKSYVEIVNGKGLMVSAGNLGVGLTTPKAKAHVVTSNSDGEVTEWNDGQFVVGQSPSSGVNSGGVALSYNHTSKTGFVSAHAPGDSVRDLALRGKNLLLLGAGNAERMRILPDGKVGIGTNNPRLFMEVRQDVTSGHGFLVTNKSPNPNAFTSLHLENDTANVGVLFKNSSTRNDDGGPHTMTLRNDQGDLRLMAAGGPGMQVKAGSGFVGIGTTNALAPLSIGVTGKKDSPDANMNLSADTILFGGANAGRQADSAQISVGKHQANSLCVIGMSDTAGNNRRVDIWSEAGLYLRGGNLAIGTTTTPASPVTIANAGKTNNPDGNMHIGANCILFGGNNAGRQAESASISAGLYVPNSLNIVGMASGTANTDRRIDFWAEGGMFLYGPKMHRAATNNLSTRPPVTAARIPGEITGFSSNGTTWDDGFLRLSAGAGTNAATKSFIDLTGYSQVAEMHTSIVMGTAGKEQMRITPDGNIGIGTASPKSRLQVTNGNLNLTASDNPTLQGPNGHANLGSILFFGHARDLSNDSARITCGSNGLDDRGYLAFSTSNDSAASVERMRIDANGRVGVGTSSPASAMHVAATGRVVDGQGLLLGKLNDMLKTSTVAGELLGSIEIGFAGWRDSEPNQIGAKIAALRYSNYVSPNAHLIQATELAFYTGGGSYGPYNPELLDITSERMRIDKLGRVGIGTGIPAGKLHVSTLSSDGNVAGWGAGQLVVGQEKADGPQSGGVGISYSTENSTGYISSLSPNVGWRNLHMRAKDFVFSYGGGSDLMRLQSNGYLAVGSGTAYAPITVSNTGKKLNPDSSMHICNDSILFGGPNAGKEMSSGGISVGLHVPNSLTLVGMSSDTSVANRKVDVFAEGGFNLHGKMLVEGVKPIVLKKMVVPGDNPYFNTGFSYANYVVGVVGFFAKSTTAVYGTMVLPLTMPNSGDWHLHCDLWGVMDSPEGWEVWVMAVRREFADAVGF